MNILKWKIFRTSKKNKPNQLENFCEAKIKITVPKGHAAKINKKFGRMLRTFLLAKIRPREETIGDNTIIWHLITTPTEAIKISGRLGMFDSIVQGMFNNKLVKKAIMKKVSVEQQEELKEMLLNHTKIEMINPDTDKEN